MDPITLLILGLVALATTGVSAGVTAYQNQKNIEATQQTNTQNIDFQKEVNAQQQYNLEHAHQIEMADLKAAGLNPVLTAMGGQGAPMATLNAPKAQAPQMDLSGINSAMSNLTHMATMSMMMKNQQLLQMEHNKTIQAIARGHDAQSAANAVLRKDTLDRLYQRKAGVMDQVANVGKNNLGSAKKINHVSDAEWKKIMKDFEDL